MAKLELGMISSTWLGTGVGVEEGIKKAKEIGFDTYDIFQDAARPRRCRARRHQGLVRGGRTADPLAAVRRVRPRRLQPGRAALHARPHQAEHRPGRVLRRPQRAARGRRVLLGRRGLPAAAIWDMAVDLVRQSGEYAASQGPRGRARARAVQRGAAEGRPRARALRQGGERAGGARQRRHLAPAPRGRVVRRTSP